MTVDTCSIVAIFRLDTVNFVEVLRLSSGLVPENILLRNSPFLLVFFILFIYIILGA